MSLEEDLIARGVWPLCGIDEAGRGPLAGPVSAAAVVIKPGSDIRSLMRDSKKLTSARREKLYEELYLSDDVLIGHAFVDERTIDRVNILNATMLAMQKAVAALGQMPEYALVDGNRAPDLVCRVQAVVKGDQTETSISAASIIAKVARDRYMLEMDSAYPEYGFARHKGYPTKAHYEAIERHGASAIHRLSFRGVNRA